MKLKELFSLLLIGCLMLSVITTVSSCSSMIESEGSQSTEYENVSESKSEQTSTDIPENSETTAPEINTEVQTEVSTSPDNNANNSSVNTNISKPVTTPYRFEFRNAEDGKCVISNIIFNNRYTSPITVEFPLKSPEGKEVVGIEFRSENDILPHMLLGEDWDRIIKKLEDNIETAISEGRVTDPDNEQYRFFKFLAWYSELSLVDKDGDMYDRYLADYPILDVTDRVYVLDETIGRMDNLKLNYFLLEYGISADDIKEAEQNLFDCVNNSSLPDKDEILNSLPIKERIVYPQNIKKFVFKNLNYSFNNGYIFIKEGLDLSIDLDSDITEIGDGAFAYCTGLEDIDIPDSVTKIHNYAFYNCSGLTSVIIPDSVTSIGSSAFEGCSSLTTIIFNGTEEQWQKIHIADSAIPDGIVIINGLNDEIIERESNTEPETEY